MDGTTTRWRYRGTAHCFGDDLEHDAHMMPFDLVIRRVTDPAQLLPHLFEAIRPGLAARLKAGDVLVAGRRFGKGKAHVQAYLALKSLGVAIACGSTSPQKRCKYCATRRPGPAGRHLITGPSR